MEKNGPVLLNPERRTVRINNVLCGGLVTGTDKVRSANRAETGKQMSEPEHEVNWRWRIGG